VFEKNEDYFGGDNPLSDKETPKADKLVFRVFKDSTTARLWLEKGDIDFVEKLSPADFLALEKNSNITVYKAMYPKMAYLTYDVSKPPFNDINVRKAMAYAINYHEMIDYVEKGNSSMPRGMFPEGILGYNPDRFQYNYDLNKAKEYMAASNHPNGFTVDLLYSPERRASFEVGSTYVQNYLKKIGINLRIKPLAIAAMLDAMAKGDYGITLKVWSAGLPDPDEMGGWFYDQPRDDSGWVACFWDNKKAQNAMRKARSLPNGPEREKLYNDTDETATREAIYVPLYQTMNMLAHRNNIKDFVWKPYVWVRFGAMDKH
jgi:peptide/nickel transport system substrate-binding protein